MRRLMLLGLIGLAGCKGTTGPAANRARNDKPDDPLFTIEEQQRRGRDRLPLPEEGQLPNSGASRYGPVAR